MQKTKSERVSGKGGRQQAGGDSLENAIRLNNGQTSAVKSRVGFGGDTGGLPSFGSSGKFVPGWEAD